MTRPPLADAADRAPGATVAKETSGTASLRPGTAALAPDAAASARVAVVTIASGRHEHLRRQREGLAAGHRQADLHVVVAMNDPGLAATLHDHPARPPSLVTNLAADGDRLPLAKARNLGAELAIRAGAEVLVFLDVDCIPGPDLVARYAEAITDQGRGLFSGPVAYLPPPPDEGYDLATLPDLAPAHPARPVPPDDEVVPGADHRLFWSLSFAVSAATWAELGGFSEAYDGYGAEDTDFGQVAARAGVDHRWVGGAWAYHQHHPTSDPPVQHREDIVRNAATFHARWGWWPMEGWLRAFERLGLARRDASGNWTGAVPDPPLTCERQPPPGTRPAVLTARREP